MACLGEESDSQLRVQNINVKVEYGDVQYFTRFEGENKDCISMFRKRAHHRNSTEVRIPLFDHRIELGERRYDRIVVTYKAKDQGWGFKKGRVYMRMHMGEN